MAQTAVLVAYSPAWNFLENRYQKIGSRSNFNYKFNEFDEKTTEPYTVSCY